jgi:hypothetical protein
VFVHANLLKEMPRSEFNVDHELGVFRVYKDYTLVKGYTWLRPQMQTSMRTQYNHPKNLTPPHRPPFGIVWRSEMRMLTIVVPAWSYSLATASQISEKDHLKSYRVSKVLTSFTNATEESYAP